MEMQNRIYTTIGKSGSGKSHLVAQMIDFYYKKKFRDYIVIIDTSKDYIQDKNLDYMNCAYLEDDIGDPDFERMIKEKKYILFEFGGMSKKKRNKLTEKIINAVFFLGNTLLVVDESYMFVPKTGDTAFEKACSGGRKEGIDQIYVVQRIQQIKLLILSQSDYIVSFKITESEEIKKVQKNISQSITKKDFRTLDKREYMIFSDENMDKGKNTLKI